LYYSKEYLSAVDAALSKNFVDCFGGPDRALDSFSDIQKSDQFCNDFFLTTGGIRGGSEKIDKFQPRSFNMGCLERHLKLQMVLKYSSWRGS
jgi:hypothetical protein